MSDRTCVTCNKTFSHPSRLVRHQSGRGKCAEKKLPRHTCECKKQYADLSSLYRHRRECPAYAGALALPEDGERDAKLRAKATTHPVIVQNITNTVQNIQVNTLGHHQQVTVSPTGQIGAPTTVTGSTGVGSNIGPVVCGSQPPVRLPGWPDKWPVPAVTPTAFKPLGFEISQAELEAAVGSLSESERASCARGDTLGVSRLLVEILKRVHSNPRERNVYLNPGRADQALVFIPSSWSAQPLEEATQSMFARIRKILDGAGRSSEQRTASAVAGARRGCANNLPQLARASRGQVSAHLENVRRATASGEDWLGTGGEPSDQPSFIGKEMAGHVDAAMLMPALEQATGIYSPHDASEDRAPGQAVRAITECARYVLYNNSENLTVLEANGRLYAHEHEAGWVEWARERAAAALFNRAAAILASKLREEPATPLVALRPWLGEKLPEVLASPQGTEAAARVLAHYAAAAARYYSALPRVQDPHDRKESARRILSGEPQLRYDSLAAAASHPEESDPALEHRPAADQSSTGAEVEESNPALEYLPAADRSLTDAEVEELLGW